MGARYTYPLDNLLRTAVTVTLATGTPVAGSSVDYLYDGHWARGLELDGVALDVVMEFAAPVTPAFATIGHSNLSVIAHLQGHPDATFGGGTPDVDLPFGIPVRTPDGFFTSPWIAPDPLTTDAKAFWRLHVTGNGYNVAIGEFLMCETDRAFECSYVMPGAQLALAGASVVHRTFGGAKLAYERASAVRQITGTLHLTAAELADLEALLAAVRYGVRPFFFVPRDDVDDAWLVQVQTDLIPEVPVGLGPHEYDVTFPLEMCARGTAWTNPDA